MLLLQFATASFEGLLTYESKRPRERIVKEKIRLLRGHIIGYGLSNLSLETNKRGSSA